MPDPQNPDTFEHSRVHPGIQTLVEHNQILRWYHRLITLRKSILPLESAQSSQHEHRVWIEESEQVLFLYRTLHRQRAALIIRTPTGVKWDAGSGRSFCPSST